MVEAVRQLFSLKHFPELAAPALLASLCLFSISFEAAAEAEIAAAESLVRANYYEGVPLDRASALSAEAAAHIARLLEDPGEARWHPNVLIALGMAGHPGSYEVLVQHAVDHSGELTRAEYRSALARIAAFGHLARRDPRALDWLANAIQHPNPEPPFSFGAMRGERMARQLLALSVGALALSGSDRAMSLLRSMRSPGKAREAAELRVSPASLDAAIAGLERIRDQGVETALASPFEPRPAKRVEP